MLYKNEWRELGNRIYNLGTIQQVRYPLHLWLLDKWLAKHPHWAWLDNFWSKIFPDYGDPLCAAYCFVWSQYYYRHEETLHSVEVGYDNLSEGFRMGYQKDFAGDDE